MARCDSCSSSYMGHDGFAMGERAPMGKQEQRKRIRGRGNGLCVNVF